MSREESEMRIQEYLDGRMDAAERRAFEAHVARDAVLARRIEDCRTAARALRADPPELSPGFHTRLRARFEATNRPAARWSRLLSWEAAGIFAAVVLVAALFTPFVMRQGPDRAAPAAAEPMLELGQQQRTNELAEPLDGAEAPGRSSRTVADEKGQAAGSGTDDLGETPAQPEAKAEERAWAPAPPEDRDARELKQKNRSKDESSKEAFANRTDAPATAPTRAAGKSATVGDKIEAEVDSGRRAQARVERSAAAAAPLEPDLGQQELKKRDVTSEQDAPRSRSEVSGLVSAVPPSIGLPPGVVDPGRLLQITDETAWNALIQGLASADAGVLGGYSPGFRLVLIGPGDRAVDCRRPIVRSSEGAYEIRLVPPEPGTRGFAHGCAIRLPDDGREIRMADEEAVP